MDRLWNAAILLGYVIAVAIGVSHHEIWRDEAQALLMARDSPSLGAMLWQVSYEGQPPLWHMLLFVLTRLGGGVAAMQAVHVLIAGGVAWVLLRLDLPRTALALTLAGYYFLFEYAVISRGYGLTLLFLFLAAGELRAGRLDWRCALYLGLSCLTTTHALILTCALLPWLIGLDSGAAGGSRWGKVRFLLILAVCMTEAVLCLVSVPDAVIAPPWSFDRGFLHYLRTAEAVFENAFLFLPRPRWPQPWIVCCAGGPVPGGVLPFLAAAVLVFRFGGRRSGAIFLSGTAGLLALFLLKYFGGARHHGLLWAWFLFSLLISAGAFRRLFEHRAARTVFVLLAAIHIPAGVAMWASDIAYPFSQAKAVAGWLAREQGPAALGDVRFGGRIGTMMTPIAAYAGGSFLNFGGLRAETFVRNDLRAVRIGLPECPGDPALPALLIFNKAMTPLCPGYKERAAFGGAMVADEDFWIYDRPGGGTGPDSAPASAL